MQVPQAAVGTQTWRGEEEPEGRRCGCVHSFFQRIYFHLTFLSLLCRIRVCLLSPEACAFNVTCNDSLACPLSLVLAAVIALSGTGIAGGSVAPWRELCSFWPTKLNFPGPGHTALPATITPRPPSILAWRLRL